MDSRCAAVKTHLGAEGDAAAHQQGGPPRPTPGLARPLLVERLPAAAADLGARQRAGCASVGWGGGVTSEQTRVCGSVFREKQRRGLAAAAPS